jgi:hypothetical protein
MNLPMQKTSLLTLTLSLWFVAPALAQPAQAETTSSQVAAAGKQFLAALDESQRGKVVFDFKDQAQRQRWSNFPTGIFQREGLRMGDLTPAQREAALAVLAAALSPQGYDKVLQIVEGDEVLRQTDGGGAPRGTGGFGGPGRRGGPGGGLVFGRDHYYISFLGQPSATEPWLIQFGGHHLAINITLAGDQGTLGPSHTGAQPAIYEIEGKTVRPLGREYDKAFALLKSLDEAQRKQAILGVQMRDLVLGPGRDGQTIQPEGIKGSALTEAQRGMLLELAGEWIGIQTAAVANAKREETRKNLSETWFAWSGPTEKGSAAYFRIQGPTVFIEYAPQRMGGDPTRHIHTIYRDPANDYGAKWWKQ